MELREAFSTAVAHHRAGRLTEAEALYRACLKAAPSLGIAVDNLAQLLLSVGRYEEGFQLYEVRFQRPTNRVPRPSISSCPEWQGEPIGSLVVFGEQGFGDQIQFVRFPMALAAQGVRITLFCSPELEGLFSGLGFDARRLSAAMSAPRHDAWTMLCSMPARMGATLETLPPAPYLPAKAGGSGIGLAWRGRPTQANDANRSLPRPVFEHLKRATRGISLDPEDTGARDFAETAEIIAGLDLVITVDTSIAHLAGAMGKRCWVMLCENPCWRWLRDRTDSPWYPSMRLFRQPAAGDWASVITEFEAELAHSEV